MLFRSAGKYIAPTGEAKAVDLIDAMVAAADELYSDEEVKVIERSACPTCGSCSGMFTANSMNCLAEALGLALPGNGTIVATHADRKELFLRAGRLIVELAKRHYEGDDDSILPRAIGKKAFENAITLDIAMGGSTNTILHILAAAQEAGIDFDMTDIDRLSRSVPQLCKVAPNTNKYHIEDVHRAGGIMAILGELDDVGGADECSIGVARRDLARRVSVGAALHRPAFHAGRDVVFLDHDLGVSDIAAMEMHEDFLAHSLEERHVLQAGAEQARSEMEVEHVVFARHLRKETDRQAVDDLVDWSLIDALRKAHRAPGDAAGALGLCQDRRNAGDIV